MDPAMRLTDNFFTTKISLTLIILLLLGYGSSVCAETLQEGVWKGTYSAAQFQAKYYISNSGEGDKTKSNIKMVLPDLEPRLDFTYELKDVLISDKDLSFTIHKKNEIQKCTLQRNDKNQFSGTCLSDADKEGTTMVDISMIPPTAEIPAPDTSAEELKTEQEK